MSALRRRSLVLSLVAATTFTGVAAAPAVADEVSASVEGSGATGSLPEVSTDLPTSSTDVQGSVEGSFDDNCGSVGTDPSVAGVLRCGIAVVAGATVFFQIAALARSLFYTVTGV